MDEIHYYFEPYTNGYKQLPGFSKEDALGNSASFNKGEREWFLNVETGILIIGVPESRNGADNHLCAQSPDAIRHWLYSFRNIEDIVIYDAGNLKGDKVKDRYKALQESIDFFYKKEVVLVVIGGTHELTYPMVKALNLHRDNIHLAVGDALMDVGSKDDFTSRNWLNPLMDYINKERGLKIDFFALQNYLVSNLGIDFLEESSGEVLWLGEMLGQEISKIEVLMRQSDMVSIDFRFIENQPQFDETIRSPHGVTNNAACAIARYAGLSDKLKVFGLFETVLNKSNSYKDSVLAGQMIWHFIEGVEKRYLDYPAISPENYKVYYVHIESLEENLKFYQNVLNNRWWISVTVDNKEELIACSYEDYQQSLKNEIPGKWMRYNDL